MAYPAATADLIVFLQALPESRKRQDVRYPQWLILLMAILGILSGCRSARDLERFAKRHHRPFAVNLDLELPKAPCYSTFLYLFERVGLEQLFGLLREWMIGQIEDQNQDFDQFICDGKTLRARRQLGRRTRKYLTPGSLRGSAAQPDGADGVAQGFDTFLMEGGPSLSGGQRQRLEIARALLQDPSILILDEATAALDSTTEERVVQALQRRACTQIMIAHRLSSVREADMILVLEDGQVVQQGSHGELLQDVSGTYEQLVGLQS